MSLMLTIAFERITDFTKCLYLGIRQQNQEYVFKIDSVMFLEHTEQVYKHCSIMRKNINCAIFMWLLKNV